MVETRLRLEPEVQAILEHIDQGHNFVLSGGAGSGKTYSLVQVIRQVIDENPNSKVACMTFTNAAVKEIEDRVDHNNLNVSTIHDFLWDTIKNFQKELKATIIELANEDEEPRISIDDPNPVPADFFELLEKGIQYKEFLRLKEGIISHDELLVIANRLFANYPKLSDVAKDKYKFIFIDEYQDTSALVIDIFLNQFNKSGKSNILGFFGDAMQSIYDAGVGNIDDYKGDQGTQVREVQKTQNRRSPQRIIDLANRLRTDRFQQVPSSDVHAPNMVEGAVKEGKILFMHSNNPDTERAKAHLTENFHWDFGNAKETKELNLTHNLIADKAGFRNLMDIYDRDGILKFRNRIRDYIRDNGIRENFSNHTFGQVVDYLQGGQAGRAVQPTRQMQIFIDDHPDLYAVARAYNYEDFIKIYVDSDQLLDDKKKDEDDDAGRGTKRDNLIKHLFKIQNNISLYLNKEYNEFLRVTDFRHLMTSIEQKRVLKANIESLVNVGEQTIEEIIGQAHETGISIVGDQLVDFQTQKAYVYDQVKAVKFSEFQKLYEYLEGKTPFSTQHKTKGSEFDNVFVILNNGNWNNYNFENLFLGGGTASVLDRTQKIFYVCCTRSKENLAVFYHNSSPGVIAQASEWFGQDNIIAV